MESQSDMILAYLQQGNTLTPLEALRLFGCFRLGARIWDLKRRGYQIETRLVECGDGKHVAQYSMSPLCPTSPICPTCPTLQKENP